MKNGTLACQFQPLGQLAWRELADNGGRSGAASWLIYWQKVTLLPGLYPGRKLHYFLAHILSETYTASWLISWTKVTPLLACILAESYTASWLISWQKVTLLPGSYPGRKLHCFLAHILTENYTAPWLISWQKITLLPVSYPGRKLHCFLACHCEILGSTLQRLHQHHVFRALF